MTRNQLNEEIKTKFGTVANFCRKAEPELDYKLITNFLTRPPREDNDTPAAEKTCDRIMLIVNKTENPDGMDKYISSTDRADIYLAIVKEAGDVKTFCESHPFSYSFVSNVVSNNNRVRLKNKKVIKLIEYLKSL